MTKGWTPEHYKRQAERIHQWKPWQKSTGLKTPEGKARSAKRGYKGGTWLELWLLSRVL